MMPSGKLCPRQPKKLSDNPDYESQVYSNTRADFKLTYRENNSVMRSEEKKKLGGEGRLIAS